MNMLSDKDLGRFFGWIALFLLGFIGAAQWIVWLRCGGLSPALLLATLVLAACIGGSGFFYSRKQNRLLEEAAGQIRRFLDGDTAARLECDREGSLYKLFHAVNTLATTLSAHADREQEMKVFLRNTLSDISHQLKTPIAALSIYNGLLQDEREDAAVLREIAAKSEREIDRMERLVQSLLKITRLDASAVVMDKRPENIADMMDDMASRFQARTKMEDKRIVLSGPGDAALICDRGWLMEAISNLVKNALDHTDAGALIRVEWKCLPSITQITVKDDGSGIHPEDIHHIFKRFYRSRFSKDTQGAGLGLPLAKAIVEAHDGYISVESAFGEGSAFTISFLKLTKL